MSTNVPKIVFTPTGLDVPAESAILDGALQDWDEAFGGGMNKALETPQGQICTSLAAAIANSNALMAEFVNQVDPDTASGFMQDAIARIYFLDRIPGAPTVVACNLGGATGTVIHVGAEAQDTSGNLYVSLQQVTIPFSGTIACQFANAANGPVPCPASTLVSIYRAIPGWESITNPLDGIMGQDVETQAAFAYRRAQSVALNARGSLSSIYANVYDVEDVLDVYVLENTTSDIVLVGETDFPMEPHSLLVSVVGGDDDAIAQAIWDKKDVGCDYNGNTSVLVKDLSGYDPPQPEYTVKFERPDPLPILFEVQLANDPGLPSNIVDLVKAAVIATFNGTYSGTTRVRIGSRLLASKFYPAVIGIGPEVSVLSILLGSVTPTLTSQLVGVDQAPTVDESDITVTLV